MPVPAAGQSAAAGAEQLIRSASLYVLEAKLQAAGSDPGVIWRSPDEWDVPDTVLDGWIEQAAANLAFAVIAAIAVIDFPAVAIDGAMPAAVRRRIVERTSARMASMNRQGLSPVAVIEGSIGPDARAIGGACLPLLAHFARDSEVLFKNGL